MKPTKTFSGWLTRQSSGHVYFHTTKPYCVKNTRVDSRDNKTTVTYQWLPGYGGDSFFISGSDKEFPEVTIKDPIPAQMDLWI